MWDGRFLVRPFLVDAFLPAFGVIALAFGGPTFFT